jgi:hypothetical protein
MRRTATEEVKHKRAVQGALSITGASLGLAALGTKGGAVALRKYPKVMKIKPEKLDSASLGLMTTGAGVGGLSGYHYAALQRAENKSQKKMERDNKMLEHSAFGVVNKANWDDDSSARAAQYAGYGAAAAGVGGAVAAPDLRDIRVKYQMRPINAKMKKQRKARQKAGDKSIRAELERNSYRAGRHNLFNRAEYGDGHAIDANIEGAERAGQKATKQTKRFYVAEKKIARLVRRGEKIKSEGKLLTPKIRVAALGLGGAGLVGSEVARQHRIQKDDWWSDSN